MSYFLDGFLDELVKLAYAPQGGAVWKIGPQGTRGPLGIGQPTPSNKPFTPVDTGPRASPIIKLPKSVAAPEQQVTKKTGRGTARVTSRPQRTSRDRQPFENPSQQFLRVSKQNAASQRLAEFQTNKRLGAQSPYAIAQARQAENARRMVAAQEEARRRTATVQQQSAPSLGARSLQ